MKVFLRPSRTEDNEFRLILEPELMDWKHLLGLMTFLGLILLLVLSEILFSPTTSFGDVGITIVLILDILGIYLCYKYYLNKMEYYNRVILLRPNSKIIEIENDIIEISRNDEIRVSYDIEISESEEGTYERKKTELILIHKDKESIKLFEISGINHSVTEVTRSIGEMFNIVARLRDSRYKSIGRLKHNNAEKILFEPEK